MTQRRQFIEPQLWSAAIVCSAAAWALFLIAELGETARPALPALGWTVYWLGWLGPAVALGWALLTRTRPWDGAIVPVALHALVGGVFLITYA